ncbi:MAG: penicillin-binding protein 2 [Gammaproteobacteria bacterium]|nr:penicillin-binding protein 2 [Gammaproteobacteria bacterium]
MKFGADSRVRLKDHLRETQLFSSRVIAAVFVVSLLVLTLIGRMIYLQILSHEHYTTLSQNNRVSLVPIPPTRGLIYDFNGVVLAQNIPSFTLEIVPEKVEDFDETIARLREIMEITDGDLERYHKIRRRTSRFKPVPLRFRLTEEEVARFAVRRHQYEGVDIQSRLLRQYPQGALGVHAIGYVGRINEAEMDTLDQAEYNGTTHIGKSGVEKSYEESLHGKVGFKRVETNAQGRIIRVLEEQAPTPGKHLYLNLDAQVQMIAEQALGQNRGAIVAIDPRTGGVIALASMPAFDPNPFVNGIDSASYAALAKNKAQPLFNRALRGRYPPGSTIKPFVGLAGLEYDLIHGGSRIPCPGYYMLKNDDRRYRDWKKEGHGEDVTLLSAIRESCDVYFYDLALNLGIDRIHEYMKQFGFGERTGIDVSGETLGLLPSREWKRRVKREPWYPGETLISGIGQGFNLASPLQLASAIGAFANFGLHMQPRLGYATEIPGTFEREYVEPEIKAMIPVLKKQNWDYVVKSMERVVHSARGTAKNISDAPYHIAGKTGTAQVFGIKQGEEYVKEEIELHLRDHALFVAFAPVDDPKIAVSVIVENGGGGGSTAAPIARAVLDAYLLKKTI